uniref:Pentatricopeptide repeat-containing protein n=1 Tax=Caenorhabditis tropicalis TaxID=1561998 RepID=A0A1I7TFB0_9PELO
MYFAVLIGMRRFEDAEKACVQLSSEIDPNDCLMAMRLMNSLKARSFDDQFMLDYAALCLRRLDLAKNKDAAQNMQADLLRICDTRHMGPTALRVFDLFYEYGIELGQEEKNRLSTVIEKHASLSKKWIFKPDGFLNISRNDDIITTSEEARIQKKLKSIA